MTLTHLAGILNRYGPSWQGQRRYEIPWCKSYGLWGPGVVAKIAGCSNDLELSLHELEPNRSHQGRRGHEEGNPLLIV